MQIHRTWKTSRTSVFLFIMMHRIKTLCSDSTYRLYIELDVLPTLFKSKPLLHPCHSRIQLWLIYPTWMQLWAFKITVESFFRDWTPGGATTQQQLSVVTTVWGVTTSTQSGPHGGGYSVGPTPQGNPNYSNGLTKVPQNNYQQAYRQNVAPG